MGDASSPVGAMGMPFGPGFPPMGDMPMGFPIIPMQAWAPQMFFPQQVFYNEHGEQITAQEAAMRTAEDAMDDGGRTPGGRTPGGRTPGGRMHQRSHTPDRTFTYRCHSQSTRADLTSA